MRCIEGGWPARVTLAVAVACVASWLLAACDKPQPRPPVAAPPVPVSQGASAPVPVPVPVPTPVPVPVPVPALAPAASSEPARASAPRARPDAGSPSSIPVRLGPPGPVRDWNEVRLQAAHRMVEAQPTRSYMVKSPDPLLAIPVLEVELNGDGSVRRIVVVRHPRQAKDTTQIAIDAVHRAAPFGDVSRLPKPWRFTETFLFDDDRRFKPRVLD